MSSTINKRNAQLLMIITAMVLALAVFGTMLNKRKHNNQIASNYSKVEIQGTLFPKARSTPNFKLTDDHGRVFSNKQLQGHWTLVFFGFSHCGYLCPVTLTELNKMVTKLKTAVPEKQVPKVVMISLDPDRDSVSRLHEYIQNFNADFVALRGDKSLIEQLSEQMSVISVKMPDDQSPEKYTLSHSGSIMLLDEQGKQRAIFSIPHKGDKLAQDYQTVLNAISQNS
jgi:protein SCO1/2